jgi:hypothetical protein
MAESDIILAPEIGRLALIGKKEGPHVSVNENTPY